MKRSKKNISDKPESNVESTNMVQATKKSEQSSGKNKSSKTESKDGSKKSKSKKKRNLPKIPIKSYQSLPKIDDFEEEEEEMLFEEIDLSRSAEQLIWNRDKLGQLKEKMYPKKFGIGGRDSCQDICNQKCLDSRIRLPPIKRTNSGNDLWDIRAISGPQNFDSKPILAVDRVNARRKEKHDNILMQLALRMNEVNEVIEKEIRKQADNVVSHTNLIKENVDNILNIIEQKQCVGLSKTVTNRMQEIMKQLNDNRLSKVDAFCDFIRKLETQRSESFKHILRKIYKDMHENMFLLPYEIQKFFEKKVQHLNQITMNNYHCYTELEGKLKLQMEEEMKTWFQKLKVYEKIKKRKSETLENPKPEADEVICAEPTVDRKREIASKLDEAEEHFRKLILVVSKSQYLRSHHVLDVFRNYLSEMMNVAASIIHADLIDHSGIHLDFKSIHELSVLYGTDEDEIQNIIREGIQNLSDFLDSNLKSFSHSTRIFDNYVDRLEEINELCRQQLFLTESRNDKVIAKMNNNINILVDKLRQDASENNLNKTISEIMSIISNIDAMLLSNLKEENAVIDKLNQLTLTNVDLLIDEMGRFVKQFAPPPDSDPRLMKKRASWMTIDEIKNNDHYFTDDFLNCRYMIDGINNWQFGIWQAFITIMETSKQVMSGMVQEVNNNKKKELKSRCELKMKINNHRMHFIREDFWKVRMVELRMHEDTMEKHRLAVEKNIADLNNLLKEMELHCRDYIDSKYMKEITKAMVPLDKVTKTRHVHAIKQNIRYLHSMALQELKPTYDRISSEYFGILMDIRNSHMKLLKSIRFFSEDGNFAVEEAKNIRKQMSALEKRLSKEFPTNKNSVKKVYDAFVEECQHKGRAYLHTLDKYIDEFTFKEEIDQKIKELNGEVKEGIYDVISDIRNLEAKFKSLKAASYAENNIGDIEWLPIFWRCFKEIQAEKETVHEKLAYYEWAPLDDKFLKRKILHSPIDSVNSARSSKSTPDVQKSYSRMYVPKNKKFEKQRSVPKYTPVAKSKNYMFILYPSQPEPENSFLSKLHCKIFASFWNIQEMAKIFYEKHEEILNRELVIPEYKSFIEEFLAKYKFYQLQLEFVWLECVAEFMKLVSNFQKYLDDYYRDTLIKFFEVRKAKLKEIYIETVKKLEENIESIEEYYMSAHRKLKTMFGHPNMANMLTTIEEYMNQAENFGKKTLLNNLTPFKETIKEHCANTESIFTEMEKTLTCIRGSTETLTLKNDLENQLLEKTERMQKILSVVDDPDEEDFDEYHVVKNVARKVSAYKKKAQIPPEVVISYTSIIKSRTVSETIFGLLNTEVLLRENYDDFEIYAEKVESFREKCSTIHQKYKTMWKQDIERILKLFQVKYDYPTIE